jgi:dihydropyrimidinase
MDFNTEGKPNNKRDSLLLKNGTIVTDASCSKGDLFVRDGKIQTMGIDLTDAISGTKIIDAEGFYIFPGGIDPHVHMELPVGNGLVSSDNFESGSLAAIAGGTTTIIDFVTPERDQSLIEALEQRKDLASKSYCDFGLHMTPCSWNKSVSNDIKRCVEKEGIFSFKVYMAYKDFMGLHDRDLIRVMDTVSKLDGLVTVHCEHGDMVTYLQEKFISNGCTSPRYHPMSRPPYVESEAVNRAMMLARYTECPLYIVHVSTEEAMIKIQGAQKSGQKVIAETCPHYLLLDDKEYQRPGFDGAKYVMSPPLRKETDRNALWKALEEEFIQVVATDHCPFLMKGGKDRGIEDFTKIPNGVPGIEDRMTLLFTYGVLQKRLTLNQFVNASSTAAARIFGLYPRKGAIQEGSDADLVIWDPNQTDTISVRNHHQNCDTNIYEGFKRKGKPRIVIKNGQIAYNDGIFTLKSRGNYLYRTKPQF